MLASLPILAIMWMISLTMGGSGDIGGYRSSCFAPARFFLKFTITVFLLNILSNYLPLYTNPISIVGIAVLSAAAFVAALIVYATASGVLAKMSLKQKTEKKH